MPLFLDGILLCSGAPHRNSSVTIPVNDTISTSVASGWERWRHLIEATEESASAQGAPSSSGDVSEWFPYASSTMLYGVVAVVCCVAAVVVRWRYHGLRLLVGKEGRGTSPEALARRQRRLSQPTDFLAWVLYFALDGLGAAMIVVTLQVAALQAGEGGLIVSFFERVLLGGRCMALAVALSQQRLHRVWEHRKHKKVSPRVAEVVRRLSISCVGCFCVISVADFLGGHFVSALSTSTTASSALYWLYISALVIMHVPIVCATVWVVLNRAAIQASLPSKIMLSVAVVVHLLSVWPPSLWNSYIWPGWVAQDPCPLAGGRMPAVDVIVAAHAVSMLLFFVFVAVEHRRNRVLGQSEHYAAVCARLDEGDTQHPLVSAPGSSRGTSAATSSLATPRSSNGSELGAILVLNEEAVPDEIEEYHG